MAKCENALKVIFNHDDNKTRIIYVDLASNYNEFLKSLQSYGGIENMFKYWIDNDDDKVEIKGGKSYEMFLKIATKKRIFIDYKNINIEKEVNNLNITSPSSLEPISYVTLEDVEIHEHVECNVCKLYPILGLRYKCIICPDYDLCMTCNNKCYHSDHKMMRISSREDYLFALKELEINYKQNNISPASVNPEIDLINLDVLKIDKKPSTFEETSISSFEYSILKEETSIVNEDALIDNKNSINNDCSIINNQKSLIVDKEIANKNEIFMNLNQMFSKISHLLDNKININSEIIQTSKMLTKQLTPRDTITEKDYESTIISNQKSYDSCTNTEIFKIFNNIFSKISDALGSKIDINNEIIENNNILKIKRNENQMQHVNVLLPFESNIILNNFNKMFSKIFNVLEHNHFTEESIEKLNNISGHHDSIEGKQLFKEKEIQKPTINYAKLSRSLYKEDDSEANNLKKNEIDKSVADLMALGYENKDGWIENLLESFDGDIVRAKDFLKPLNETFD